MAPPLGNPGSATETEFTKLYKLSDVLSGRSRISQMGAPLMCTGGDVVLFNLCSDMCCPLHLTVAWKGQNQIYSSSSTLSCFSCFIGGSKGAACLVPHPPSMFKNNTKKLWQLINRVIGKENDKSNVIECIKINNIRNYIPKQIANQFRKHYSTLGDKYAKKIPNPQKNIETYLTKICQN